MPPSPRAEPRRAVEAAEDLDADLLRSWSLPVESDGDKYSRGTVLVIGGSTMVGYPTDNDPVTLVERYDADFAQNILHDAINPNSQGCVAVPQGPGLGVDPDVSLMAKLRTQ